MGELVPTHLFSKRTRYRIMIDSHGARSLMFWKITGPLPRKLLFSQDYLEPLTSRWQLGWSSSAKLVISLLIFQQPAAGIAFSISLLSWKISSRQSQAKTLRELCVLITQLRQLPPYGVAGFIHNQQSPLPNLLKVPAIKSFHQCFLLGEGHTGSPVAQSGFKLTV